MQLKSARITLLLLGLGLATVACGDSDSPTAPQPFDVQDVVFADELTVSQADLEETDSGLFYHDVVVGEGPDVTDQSIVQLHYTLWLPDGSLLADTRQSGQVANWDLAQTTLIPGFMEGLLDMREGGTRVLVVPPELAYGEMGSGPIPPNSGLVFQIELLTVTSAFDVNDVVFADELSVTIDDLQETQSGLYYYDAVVGDGAQPTDQSTVEVHFTLWLPDATVVVDTRESGEAATFDLGLENLILGFEEGVLGMNEGGTRILVLPPELAYGEEGNEDIPPHSGVVLRVELLTVTTPSA